MKQALMFVVVCAAMFVAGFAATGAFATNDKKVTICHAAGLDGTTKYVTLTISENAVYGPGGHFNENGTPQAGHEDDYLGACEGDETTTTDTTDTTDTTTTDETTTTPTTPCPITPSNPTGSLPNPPGGKDGKPGNDACLPDPVEPTTPTETVTTPTTPEEPSPENPVCSPGTHGTYPDCIGNEEPASNPKPPVTAPPVKKPDLEKELDKQAKKNGAVKSGTVTASNPNELPNTGVPLLPVALLGGLLAGSGWVLRRKS